MGLDVQVPIPVVAEGEPLKGKLLRSAVATPKFPAVPEPFRPVQLRRLAPAVEAQGLLLPPLPAVESTSALNTKAEGSTKAGPERRDDVAPPAGARRTMSEVNPAQAGSVVGSRTIAHPVRSLGKVELPQVLVAALGTRVPRARLAIPRQPMVGSAEAVATTRQLSHVQVRPLVAPVRASIAAITNRKLVARNLRIPSVAVRAVRRRVARRPPKSALVVRVGQGRRKAGLLKALRATVTCHQKLRSLVPSVARSAAGHRSGLTIDAPARSLDRRSALFPPVWRKLRLRR